MTELYKKYRPKTLKGVVGQDGVMKSIHTMTVRKTVPHAILFTGPSGCGKTTIARILKTELGCGDGDFHEINSADFRGVETVREIRRNITLAPMSGECRIWLIDEAHKLTGDAQNSLLKMLEDTPSHVYFMLATTDPQKLIRTIHTRCTEFKLAPIPAAGLEKLILRIATKEKLKLSENVVDEIVAASENSARKALVILEQIGSLKTEEAQLQAIEASSSAKQQAIDLARALLDPRKKWPEIAAILKGLDEDPESIRFLILGYCRSVLLGGGKLAERAYNIIVVFSDNFWNSKQAGLAAACWEVCHR